jgi:hypothetical protein
MVPGLTCIPGPLVSHMHPEEHVHNVCRYCKVIIPSTVCSAPPCSASILQASGFVAILAGVMPYCRPAAQPRALQPYILGEDEIQVGSKAASYSGRALQLAGVTTTALNIFYCSVDWRCFSCEYEILFVHRTGMRV